MRLAPSKGETAIHLTVPTFSGLERFSFSQILFEKMRGSNLRTLSALILTGTMLSPSVTGRTTKTNSFAPAEAMMQVHVTYNEEANITDRTRNDNGAQEEDVSSFRFRATAEFE